MLSRVRFPLDLTLGLGILDVLSILDVEDWNILIPQLMTSERAKKRIPQWSRKYGRRQRTRIFSSGIFGEPIIQKTHQKTMSFTCMGGEP